MKRSRMMGYITAGALVLLAVTLTSCGGGGYGGGGGGMGFAPAAFTLSSPANMVTGATTTPTLTWTSSLYAADYRVQIDTVITFASPTLVVNAVVAAPTMTYPVPASTLTSTLYYWRVIAENANGQAVAGPQSFTP
jgi:hypothetical protein